MSYFPFFVDIKNKNFLLVGGGSTALRKAEVLSGFGCKIHVVSPKIDEKIKSLTPLCVQKEFNQTDLEGIDFAIAATDSSETNSLVSRLCKEKNIPVNSVDSPEECTFFFPAIYKNKEVVAGISTGGQSPLTASKIRRHLEETLPQTTGDAAKNLGMLRERMKKDIPRFESRKKACDELYDLFISGNTGKDEIDKILNKYISR